MTTEIQELPETGEIVIATVTKVSDHGAYVSLDEYNNVQGFLHISEIAPGWVRNVGRFVKEGEKKVLLVKKVRSDRKEIDLSLKQISKDQKKKKLLEVKRYEKGKTIMQSVKEVGKISDKDLEALEESIFSKYNSIYDAFLDVARKGIEILNDLKLPKKTITAIKEVSSKIKLPSVQIRGILQLTCTKPDGVEVIKKILGNASKQGGDSKVEVTYVGAPKYRISVSSVDFKSAERTLKPIIDEIQSSIEKQKGTFSFVREDSKKTRDG
ncbi:MAG: translation initiation factor IF-2 subunit alpha [Nitrosopumilaceae archaeon]